MQDIKVGDEVLSENAKTGKTEYQPVTALTHPHLDTLLEIHIEGEAEALRPSTGHPFWTRSAESDAGRWVKAGDLRAGDFLETPAGGWRRVVSVTTLPGEQTVYNFTVDQDHDYFVGQTGFLVHNTECPCNLRYTDRMSNTQYRKLVKDIGENGIQNKLINYVSIGEDNYVLWGINRLMAARRLGLVDQLEFQEVQLPFQGFQTEEDVINSAANFYSGGSCIY